MLDWMTPTLARRLGPEVARGFDAHHSDEHHSQEHQILRAETDTEWRHPWPDEMHAVWTTLCTADPSLLALGWEPVMADLTQVRALQPVVSVDDPRCEGLDGTASFSYLAEIVCRPTR